MKAVVGTAGHIDHGKSAIVRALTGIDPDRLPAEKARGISIELGFAYLETPDGDRIGIVDVPGHERFVRQMLAGAQGFDYVLVVVAADDGVMPQTEEHFEICHLLGLHSGAFVVTKRDLVSAERLAEVRDEIALLADRTAFADAPVFDTSAISGEGISALRDHLFQAVARVERKPMAGEPFRLPVDRVFVLKGHGVVVTGTAASGAIASGDDVVVAASGERARVREVQVHGRPVDRGWSGERIALNLAAIGQDAVARGDTIVHAGAVAAAPRFDAQVEVRPAALRPLRSQERVRVHLGTANLPARLVWLGDRDEVAPRASGYASLVLSGAPVIALSGDRFVLRDETDRRTLGGGVVLLAPARKRRQGDGLALAELERLASSDPVMRMTAYLRLHRDLGTTLGDVARGTRLPLTQIASLAEDSTRFARFGGDEARSLVAARDRYDAYLDELVARVREFHTANPSASGIELERLRQELDPTLDSKEFRGLVDSLVAEGRVERRGGALADLGHRPMMEAAGERLAEIVLEQLRSGRSMPPSTTELQERLGVAAPKVLEVLGVLVARSAVVKVSSDLYFASEPLTEIEARLRAHLEKEDTVTAAGFRDLISASRKYSIPLLDHFDRSGLTVRTGDYRRLRSKI
jgi:selenocysteine-specific elongation factor